MGRKECQQRHYLKQKLEQKGHQTEAQKERRRKYYYKNREEQMHKSVIWAKANPDKVKRTHLWRQYKLHLEDYENMWLEQQGQCAICSVELIITKGKLNTACVDHDHSTGKVRGILCRRCNNVLGFNKDDITIFEKQQSYLKRTIGVTKDVIQPKS